MEGSIKVNFPRVSLKVNLPFFNRRSVSLPHVNVFHSDPFNVVLLEWSVSISLIHRDRIVEPSYQLYRNKLIPSCIFKVVVRMQ